MWQRYTAPPGPRNELPTSLQAVDLEEAVRVPFPLDPRRAHPRECL